MKTNIINLITTGGYSLTSIDESSILLFKGEIEDNDQAIYIKDAIEKSFLYAQLEANNEYDKLSQQDDWCNTFKSEMEYLGWTFDESFIFSGYDNDYFILRNFVVDGFNNLSEIETLLLADLFDKVEGSPQVKPMTQSQENGLEKFLEFSTNSHSANLRLGICIKCDNNEIKLKLGSFHFNTDEQIQDIFDTNFDSKGNVFKSASGIISLDLSIYENRINSLKKRFPVNESDYMFEV